MIGSTQKVSGRQGFTILELTVSLTIIGVLAALLIPAIQYARNTARATTCKNRLRQIGVAVESYTAAHGVFPPQGEDFLSGHVNLLPFMEQANLHELVTAAPYVSLSPDQVNSLAMMRPTPFVCPSDSDGATKSSYLLNRTRFVHGRMDHGAIGPFGAKRTAIGPKDVRDGMSNTVSIAESFNYGMVILQASPAYEEALIDCRDGDNTIQKWRAPWFTSGGGRNGYSHALTPNQTGCGASSWWVATAGSSHRGGVHALRLDGGVQFIAEGVAAQVWEDMGTIDGNETLIKP